MALPNQEQYYNTPEIQSAEQNLQSASTTAGTYQEVVPLLEQKLKQAINEKLNYNQDIIKEQNEAMGNYFAAPATARSDYQNIWNPFDREKLVAQATANAYAPYATLSDILSARKGNVADLVNAGAGAFQSAATAQQNKATQAQTYLDTLLAKAQRGYEGAKYNYEWTHSKPSSVAGKSVLEKMIEKEMLKQMGYDENGNPLPPEIPNPKTPEPIYTPIKGNGSLDDSGEWVYMNGKWNPTMMQSNSQTNQPDMNDTYEVVQQ